MKYFTLSFDKFLRIALWGDGSYAHLFLRNEGGIEINKKELLETFENGLKILNYLLEGVDRFT